jgi:hypothetical protein
VKSTKDWWWYDVKRRMMKMRWMERISYKLVIPSVKEK